MKNLVFRFNCLQPTRHVSLSGTEANIEIRERRVNSSVGLFFRRFRDRCGAPMRLVALTSDVGVSQVYVQQESGSAIQPGDWLEGERPKRPPRPKKGPVKAGSWVWAKPEDGCRSAGIVISLDWAQKAAPYPRNLPPFWFWGWCVEVRFSDGRIRQGFWDSDWVCSFKDRPQEGPDHCEELWRVLEEEFSKEQVAR